MSRRLANVKTRREAGLDYVISQLHLGTPFGKLALKEQKPFFPGEEDQLREEFQRIDWMLDLITGEEELHQDIYAKVFHDMKDISHTITRSKDNVLSVVELFELKMLLLGMTQLVDLLKKAKAHIPEEFVPGDVTCLLDRLDPRKDRLGTFYIYEEFSKKLADLRGEKRQLEISLRKVQKALREEIKSAYGVTLTPKFDTTVSKSDMEEVQKLSEISQLEITDQDYMSITFSLAASSHTDEIRRQTDKINEALEAEEERIREELSREVWKNHRLLLGNCRRIGKLDLTLAKAVYSHKNQCTQPEISEDYRIEIREGRHLYVEDLLLAKEKSYIPISVTLEPGVSCITGANMGGKTVTLKLVGLIAVMAQYGYFVPAQHAKIGLSSYMQMLIGDSQSLERGLSSFGSEMEELKEILDRSKDRSLILIDEIASGTNPAEGLALTRSLVEYLKDKNYITLITTHFDIHTAGTSVENMQVVGLANADFEKLNKEIRYADRKSRIDIIGKYMDYRLTKVKGQGEIPKDALNIAKMLGIGDEIIEKAKEYLKENK
ncbi:MAG: MutS-related protein [Anaerovoracaceae bacterium]|jgi:DNA mismatch repair protein MutS2